MKFIIHNYCYFFVFANGQMWIINLYLLIIIFFRWRRELVPIENSWKIIRQQIEIAFGFELCNWEIE